IGAREICFVVIDSWGAARVGEAESSDLTIRAFHAARSLAVPWMAIDHLPKNAHDKSKPFGSVYTHNLAWLTWRAEAVPRDGEGHRGGARHDRVSCSCTFGRDVEERPRHPTTGRSLGIEGSRAVSARACAPLCALFDYLRRRPHSPLKGCGARSLRCTKTP